MTSREQFEKWFKSDYHPDKSGPYLKDALFLAWQASRAAIEIELPKPMSANDQRYDSFQRGEEKAINSCIEAIESAGLKVKGD